jgi:hypothetical protein
VFVEAVYPVSIVDSVVFCLLDVVLLGLEEFTLLIRSLYAALYILASYFEISLLARSFKESLVGIMFCLDLITRIDLLRPDIAPSLLLVHLAVFLIVVFADSTCCTIYIRVSSTLTLPSITL